MSPRQGPTSGGTVVIVSGVDFPLTSSVSCSFGGVSMVGRVLDSMTVECMTPKSQTGTVLMHLSINDVYAYDGIGYTFSFEETLFITSFSPLEGGSDGGTNVTITGSDFFFHDDLSCRFGDSEVMGVFVTAQQIGLSSCKLKVRKVHRVNKV